MLVQMQKKKQWFIHGLSTKLQRMLTNFTNAGYHEAVSMAISFEEKNRLHQETKKRKLVSMGYSGGNNQC
jgi:hypothetical protein